jgi:Zn-dependent protease with chaperone function
MSYSRNFEREADDSSLVFLDANKIPRHHFINLMERLTYQAQCNQLMMRDTVKKHYMKKISKVKSSTPTSSSSSSSSAQSVDDEIEADSDVSWIDAEANRQQCDRLIAEHKDNFFQTEILGYFSSHPETGERTQKFK